MKIDWFTQPLWTFNSEIVVVRKLFWRNNTNAAGKEVVDARSKSHWNVLWICSTKMPISDDCWHRVIAFARGVKNEKLGNGANTRKFKNVVNFDNQLTPRIPFFSKKWRCLTTRCWSFSRVSREQPTNIWIEFTAINRNRYNIWVCHSSSKVSSNVILTCVKEDEDKGRLIFDDAQLRNSFARYRYVRPLPFRPILSLS